MPDETGLVLDLDQGNSTPTERHCGVIPDEEREMLKVEMDRKAGYLELTVDGRIEKADFERAVEAVDTLLKTHKKIDVLEAVVDVGLVEPDVWWMDIVFHLSHHNFLRRVAVVSDSGWVGPLPAFSLRFIRLPSAPIRWGRFSRHGVGQGKATKKPPMQSNHTLILRDLGRLGTASVPIHAVSNCGSCTCANRILGLLCSFSCALWQSPTL